MSVLIQKISAGQQIQALGKKVGLDVVYSATDTLIIKPGSIHFTDGFIHYTLNYSTFFTVDTSGWSTGAWMYILVDRSGNFTYQAATGTVSERPTDSYFQYVDTDNTGFNHIRQGYYYDTDHRIIAAVYKVSTTSFYFINMGNGADEIGQTGNINSYKTINGIPDTVDLTTASSDYDLKKDQTAIITFSSATSVPLHIATGDGTKYDMSIQITSPPLTTPAGNATGGVTDLYPNGSTITSAKYRSMYSDNSSSSPQIIISTTATKLRVAPTNASSTEITLYNSVGRKELQYQSMRDINSDGSYGVEVGISQWIDTITSWSSIGTVVFAASCSGHILVKRMA